MMGQGMSGYNTPNGHFNGDAWEFIPNTIRGMRVWDVDLDGFLVGVSFRGRWLLGENQARCLAGNASDEPTARTAAHELNDKCPCGLHAYFTDQANAFDQEMLVSTASKSRTTYRVTGVVEGYGKCVVGPLGMRCSKARIAALTVRPAGLSKWSAAAMAALLGRYQSIPMFTDHTEMLTAFPVSPHPIGPGLPAKPETGSAA